MEQEVAIEIVKDYEKEIDGKLHYFTVARCSKHGEYEYENFGGFTISICPQCANEKAIEGERFEKEVEEQDKITRQKRIAERMNDPVELKKMGIGKRYYDANFDDWIPESGNDYLSDLQKKAKDGVIRATKRKSGTVVLMGGTGTRKTTLVCASMRVLGEGYLTTMYECSFRLRSQDFKDNDELVGFKFLRFLKTCPVLCIDEIGRTSCTDFDKQWLSDVINSRDADDLLTYLVSNYPTKAITPKGYEGIVLDEVLGSAVMSRLSYAEQYRVSGTDFRTIFKIA